MLYLDNIWSLHSRYGDFVPFNIMHLRYKQQSQIWPGSQIGAPWPDLWPQLRRFVTPDRFVTQSAPICDSLHICVFRRKCNKTLIPWTYIIYTGHIYHVTSGPRPQYDIVNFMTILAVIHTSIQGYIRNMVFVKNNILSNQCYISAIYGPYTHHMGILDY